MPDEPSSEEPDIFPDESELPDDPPSIDEAPIIEEGTAKDADTVMEYAQKDWEQSTTARERVRAVMRKATKKQTVSEIAASAAVSETTARNELSTLVEQGIVASHETDTGKVYRRDPSHYIFQRIDRISQSNDLIEQIRRVRDEIEGYRDRYQSQSPEELLVSERSLDRDELEDISYWRTAERKLKFLRAAYRVRDVTEDMLVEPGDSETGTAVSFNTNTADPRPPTE